MFSLREAKLNEELVIKEIWGTEAQIIYLKNVGISIGKTIIVEGHGTLLNTLIVCINQKRFHLNPDAVGRIMVEEKTKVLKKQ